MPPLDVIVSSGGKFHAYHLARASADAGYLKRFITTIYDRHEAGIDRRRVKQIVVPELLGMAIQRLPGAGSVTLSYLVRDNLFDRLSCRYVDGGDVFDVFNHFGLHSMRKAHALGMTCVVERSSAHPVVHHKILSEEYTRYGLRYSPINTWLFAKHEQEYEEADAIAVPSEFVWRTMVEGGVPASKLRRVHFGFAPERFRPMPDEKTDSTFRVMFAGAISLQKGVQYLLEAWRRLDLPDAELVLVGGTFPDSRAFLPRYEGLYRHVPFVPQSELAAIYNTASVFVLPSLQDGFGMVVYEAAACGLPVIITENVGAEIRDGQDGYIVPIRDPDALADRLLRLYRDEKLRREMGESARAFVQQYTWEAYHRQVLTHYHDLTGK
jgi:glycosyltransferase involved in cell wall biosynthesis